MDNFGIDVTSTDPREMQTLRRLLGQKAPNVDLLAKLAARHAQAGDDTHLSDVLTPNIEQIAQAAERQAERVVNPGSPVQKAAPAGHPDPRVNPAFREWFGQSKVVGDDGKPLVMYHATNRDFHTFEPSRFRGGIYLAHHPDAAMIAARAGAREFGSTEGPDRILPLYVRSEVPYGEAYPDSPHVHAFLSKVYGPGDATYMPDLHRAVDGMVQDAAVRVEEGPHKQRILDVAREIAHRELRKRVEDRSDPETGIGRMGLKNVTGESVPWQIMERGPSYSDPPGIYRKALQALGYDSAYVGDEGWGVGGISPDRRRSLVVFHPHQIKSAIGNAGSYDPADPDIRKAAGGIGDHAAELERHAIAHVGEEDWGMPDPSDGQSWEANAFITPSGKVTRNLDEPHEQVADQILHRAGLVGGGSSLDHLLEHGFIRVNARPREAAFHFHNPTPHAARTMRDFADAMDDEGGEIVYETPSEQGTGHREFLREMNRRLRGGFQKATPAGQPAPPQHAPRPTNEADADQWLQFEMARCCDGWEEARSELKAQHARMEAREKELTLRALKLRPVIEKWLGGPEGLNEGVARVMVRYLQTCSDLHRARMARLVAAAGVLPNGAQMAGNLIGSDEGVPKDSSGAANQPKVTEEASGQQPHGDQSNGRRAK
jgi:hypothetical protein